MLCAAEKAIANIDDAKYEDAKNGLVEAEQAAEEIYLKEEAQ